MSERLSYPALLDSMVRIARETADQNSTVLQIADAFDAGRRFVVPKQLQKYFDAAISDARMKDLREDPERVEFERLQAKFAPLLISEHADA